MSVRPLYITVLSITGLFLGACTSKAQANDDPKESVVAVSETSPQAVETYTIEEIRAEQKVIEGQIERIKAKGELEKADKIILIKLERRYNSLLSVELNFQEHVIDEQRESIANEFALIRKQTQE